MGNVWSLFDQFDHLGRGPGGPLFPLSRTLADEGHLSDIRMTFVTKRPHRCRVHWIKVLAACPARKGREQNEQSEP